MAIDPNDFLRHLGTENDQVPSVQIHRLRKKSVVLSIDFVAAK